MYAAAREFILEALNLIIPWLWFWKGDRFESYIICNIDKIDKAQFVTVADIFIWRQYCLIKFQAPLLDEFALQKTW